MSGLNCEDARYWIRRRVRQIDSLPPADQEAEWKRLQALSAAISNKERGAHFHREQLPPDKSHLHA